MFSVDNIRPPKQHKRTAYGEKVRTARMDLMFLILFPCIFFIFNIVYWVGFLYVVPKSTDGLGEYFLMWILISSVCINDKVVSHCTDSWVIGFWLWLTFLPKDRLIYWPFVCHLFHIELTPYMIFRRLRSRYCWHSQWRNIKLLLQLWGM